MNVIYNNCFADPWVEIAKALKSEFNLQPAYWLGYADDESKNIVPSTFPEIVYHEYFNAWKGVFPENIETLAQNYCVDPEFYKKLAEYELQGLNIMDRMDMDWQSFSFSERRLLFRKFIRYWLAVIDFYKIDLLISPTIPHQSFDYPLYLVCREKGIKTISFISTPFCNAARILSISDIYRLPEKVKNDYKKSERSKKKVVLADDIQLYLNKINSNYEEAKPDNFKEYNRFHKDKPSVLQTGKRFFFDLKKRRSFWAGREKWLISGVPSYTKDKRRNIEESRSRLNFVSYVLKIYKRVNYLKKLRKEYSRISVKNDLNANYVIFALHYQPEATTAPRAEYFADQLYIIELLSKYLPSDWKIYVKENPKQFNPIAEGNTGRLLRFYKDALRFPGVSFVPVNSDPFKLIDKTKAVITLGGTIGWEAMVRKKPVICFANTWYEYFDHGVFRVSDESDLKKMTEFINSYKYDHQKLLTYLKAVEDNSVTAYFRRGLKQGMNMKEEDCVDTLVNKVVDHFGLKRAQ